MVKGEEAYVSIYKPYELSEIDKATGIEGNNLISQKQFPITYKSGDQLVTAHASFSIYEDAQRAAIDKAIELLI